ncbi:hypothetical protein CEUSTIGMA_g294.t1 [Chlamydomonas eustigma]|uniref:Protein DETOXIFICATION n=1 Tax=Chlamydomonas eustigma TaxID=1157962 RepID=A0A250WQ69_9CHLO|nr:hypothetical protein CEUSTIGMA_g294.t1 [Chlamydomonas eustigma]|eukprot:GAX72839.1 hypothetical protein CEUSTIGMA_g294.t1 [Chlamydomonas eustigma]
MDNSETANPEVDTAPLSKSECKEEQRPSAIQELGGLVSLAFPVVLQNIFGYMTSLVSAAFVGHLGSQVLSSVVMASSLYNVTGLSIVVGLASGMETMCGQAYGAQNYKMLGLVMQRALLVCWGACIPITLFLSHSKPALLLMSLPPEVADGASRYLLLMTPALFANALSSVLNRYLTSQRIMIPNTLCTVASACLCPVYNWMFIHRLQLGLDGAAYANALSQVTSTIILTTYVFWRDFGMIGSVKGTWPGLQFQLALESSAVYQYLSFGVPAAAMICLEWWAFEVLIILAGLIPGVAEIALSSMGITFNIIATLYMFSAALGTSANTRIANALGAGLEKSAKTTFRVAISTVFLLVSAFAVILWLCRSHLALIFTNEEEVVNMVGLVIPIVCTTVVGDGANAVFSGVLRGCGRQSLGAYSNLIGWWCVAVPLAVFLGLYEGLGIWGFWIALCCGTNIQALVFLVVISNLDWAKETQRAKALVLSHSSPDLLAQLNGYSAQEGHHRSASEQEYLEEPLLKSTSDEGNV